MGLNLVCEKREEKAALLKQSVSNWYKVWGCSSIDTVKARIGRTRSAGDRAATSNDKSHSSRHLLPHRRVTFSTANPVQDQQDSSQQSYYDSGLEESETPSSKSSSGPRIGPLALPEDHYERTTPDGSIGEMEHPENDIRSLPDVAMTGNCSEECSELGHSDACWMPGQPSPIRKTRNPPKLSTFVPYQERGSLGRLANGGVRLGGEENRPRLPPSRSAYSSSDHMPSDHAPLEEVPLSVTSEFPPTSQTSNHTSKREIYL
ncbi:putative protocadherin-1 [Triplophysa rosa]|uniref:Protocadherin-1 n=1 Tax=Triplophysa rosa TaxID=992332 RepID=A0A9W7W9Y5_TRIRA|nr:putative protocadherin-1 [Triplophysa rosa]